MFKALEFTYAGKSSNDFSLKIVNFGGSAGVSTDSIGIPLQIEEQKIKRNPKPFLFGVEITPKLSFTLQIAFIPSEERKNKIITRPEMGAISKWLFRKDGYHELKIIDTDYSNIIYNCMITGNPKQLEVANLPYGMEIEVTCDRPYGFRRQSITRTFTGSSTFNLKNLGFSNDDIYPEIEFTVSNSVSIKNNTDADNKTMTFTGLSTNETLYVDTRKQLIISSTGLNRNSDSNFNWNWFKLKSDYYNNITITGTGTVTFRIEWPMPV